MNKSSRMFRVAKLAAFLFAIITVSSCSKPPDDVLKQGIAASARMELTRMNPFAAMGDVTLKDYSITNSYKQGDVQIYEYTGTVVVKGGMGNPNPNGTEVKVKGKAGFQKAGNRWDSSPM